MEHSEQLTESDEMAQRFEEFLADTDPDQALDPDQAPDEEQKWCMRECLNVHVTDEDPYVGAISGEELRAMVARAKATCAGADDEKKVAPELTQEQLLAHLT